MKRFSSKSIALILVTLFTFASCGQPSTSNGNTQNATSQDTTSASAENTTSSQDTTSAQSTGGEAILKIAESTSCTTYNPHRAESALEYAELLWVNVNLYKRIYSEEKQTWIWAPELADGMPENTDGKNKVWKIKIQEGYTFEDGSPINAQTFVYSWKMLLDPKLANRNYNSMYLLQGAEKYYTGEETNWDNVGIKATGEYELELTCEDIYIPEFVDEILETLAFVGCSAVNEKMYESCFNADKTENSYGTTPEKFVSSGAYRLAKFIDGQYMEYEKRKGGSPYAEGLYTPDRIQVSVATESATKIQMYEKGEIDAVIANTKEYEEYPDVYYSYTPDNFGIFINSQSTTNPILANYNFRYAMYWGFDRASLVKVAFSTNKPNPYHYSDMATILDPKNPENRLKFRDLPEAKAIKMDGHELTDTGFDPELAKSYFDKAYEENGSKSISVEMQYSEGDDARKTWAEAIQHHFQELFGKDRFTMTLRAVPHASIYENMARTSLKYDMSCTAGIYQNILKPWQNSNYVYSGPDVYSTQYTVLSPEAAKEWDELYYRCQTGDYKLNPQGRIEASARMEEIIYNEATFIPAYTRGNRWLISDKLEILMKDGVGDPFLEFAFLQARFK